MRKKLVRKVTPKNKVFVTLYNIECTGSGNNGVCTCR